MQEVGVLGGTPARAGAEGSLGAPWSLWPICVPNRCASAHLLLRAAAPSITLCSCSGQAKGYQSRTCSPAPAAMLRGVTTAAPQFAGLSAEPDFPGDLPPPSPSAERGCSNRGGPARAVGAVGGWHGAAFIRAGSSAGRLRSTARSPAGKSSRWSCLPANAAARSHSRGVRGSWPWVSLPGDRRALGPWLRAGIPVVGGVGRG